MTRTKWYVYSRSGKYTGGVIIGDDPKDCLKRAKGLWKATRYVSRTKPYNVLGSTQM